jgi:hypothetical protein
MMNEELERSLLEAESRVYLSQLMDLGGKPPAPEVVEKLSMDDLRQLHRSLRDTVRSLGGAKGG